MHPELRIFPRFVYLTAAVCSAIAAVYTLLEIEPSPIVGLIVPLAPLVAIIFWFQEQARRTPLAGVQDWGLFLWIAWPVLFPWYSIKVRGLGWRFLSITVILVFSPFITMWTVAIVRWLVELTVWNLRGAA
jgi:hypothetical protein